MSDFKYAAINAVIGLAMDSADRDETEGLLLDCMKGEVPVVDGTAAWRLRQQSPEQWAKHANTFAEALAQGVMKWPLERFVLFVDLGSDDMPEGVSRCASVLSVQCRDKFATYAEFVCARVVSTGAVMALAVTDEEISAQNKNEMSGIVKCLSMWMASRNAEVVDGGAERSARRRYSSLASVRFRRVFIRTVGAFNRMQRYEITGHTCPLHHVRGHIRHVSEDRPLFGRKGAHGAFWVSEHWRGDEENGRIIQEYVPQPPEEL